MLLALKTKGGNKPRNVYSVQKLEKTRKQILH